MRRPVAPLPPPPTERRLPLGPIAGWEAAVLASIAGASGTPEERDAQIARSGLYGEYPAILDAYLALVAQPDAAPEAVKRAVFLAWIGGVEHPCRTAVRELPERGVRAAVGALEGLLQRGRGDDELRWMLAWYHGCAPALFDVYGGGDVVAAFVQGAPVDAWRHAGVDPASLANRGQLGQYWRAVLQQRRLA